MKNIFIATSIVYTFVSSVFAQTASITMWKDDAKGAKS